MAAKKPAKKVRVRSVGTPSPELAGAILAKRLKPILAEASLAPAEAVAKRVARRKSKVAAEKTDPGEWSGEAHWKMFQVLYRFIDAYENAKSCELPSGDDQFRWEDLLGFAKPVARSFEKYLEHEVRTLDEAFGAKRPPNYQQAVARERLVKSGDVFRDCMRLYHAGATIDMPLFEAVAELHSLKASKVKEYFYYARKHRFRGNKLPERNMEPLGVRYARLAHYWKPGEGPFPDS